MDTYLPGIAPTGRHVQLPHVVVVTFEGGKVAHEHIYWDQACLLVQVGLLAPRTRRGPASSRRATFWKSASR
jgi:carboxymethylenebutenolidase